MATDVSYERTRRVRGASPVASSGAHCSTDFSIREARGIVHDLFTPKPWIYWGDFLGSIAIGYLAFTLVRHFPALSLAQASAYIVSCLALYRAASFTHELVHLKGEQFGSFRFAWNTLCGVPFLMPSFMYHTHLAHHARKHYATHEDGEYLPLGAQPAWHIFVYLCQPLVIPPIAVVRFLIFTPLAWMSASFRRFVHQRMSSMVMDPTYIRPLPTPKELRQWRWQEAMCFFFVAGAAVLLLGGRLPLALVVQGYATAVGILMLNAVRTMGAHRFVHDGGEVTFIDQILDSLNYPYNPVIGELWAPVGLRFHALHHLFPSLPYHALAEAHRRLMAELPADSPYRKTVSPGLTWALADLWRNARAASR